MPTLIDNYTTVELVNNFVAKERYKTYMGSIGSSIVVYIPQQIGINSRIYKLLNEYSKLQNNWDEDDAIAPNEKVIKEVRFIVTLLEKHGQPIFHIAPGPNGEIMLDIRNSKKTRSLEVILYPNRSVVVAFPEVGKPTQQNFDINHLPELLEWLNGK